MKYFRGFMLYYKYIYLFYNTKLRSSKYWSLVSKVLYKQSKGTASFPSAHIQEAANNTSLTMRTLCLYETIRYNCHYYKIAIGLLSFSCILQRFILVPSCFICTKKSASIDFFHCIQYRSQNKRRKFKNITGIQKYFNSIKLL